jgi:hypothetical protein
MNNPGVFKIWFGGGTPDGNSQDNVWYIQTSTLDRSAYQNADIKATRCTVTPTNIWVNNSGNDWCWGDPSVIRCMSSWDPPTCTYFMWVSALAVGTTWNQIYRLTSSDGINWTIYPTTPAVAAANGGVAGYGTGSPSVVIANGYWWMWYYSQYESAGPGAYLRKSTDGLNWGAPTKTNINSALDAKYVDSLSEFVAVSDVEAQGGGVYTLTSTDGITWDGGAPPYLSEDSNAYLCHNPGLIGTDQGHGWVNMYATYGASQQAFGTTEYYTRELEYSSWHISSSSTPKISIKQTNDQKPANFELFQNYPNPFNPVTEINYSIPQNGVVTLKIYNLLGEEVAALVNRQQKAGNYTVNFNASKLTSGVYMYRIQVGDFTSTKKMTFLK